LNIKYLKEDILTYFSLKPFFCQVLTISDLKVFTTSIYDYLPACIVLARSRRGQFTMYNFCFKQIFSHSFRNNITALITSIARTAFRFIVLRLLRFWQKVRFLFSTSTFLTLVLRPFQTIKLSNYQTFHTILLNPSNNYCLTGHLTLT
jgi:hypothetical protein